MNLSNENIPLKQYICYFTAPNTINLDEFVRSRGFDIKGVLWEVRPENQYPVFYINSVKQLPQESLNAIELAIRKLGFNTFRKI